MERMEEEFATKLSRMGLALDMTNKNGCRHWWIIRSDGSLLLHACANTGKYFCGKDIGWVDTISELLVICRQFYESNTLQ